MIIISQKEMLVPTQRDQNMNYLHGLSAVCLLPTQMSDSCMTGLLNLVETSPFAFSDGGKGEKTKQET